MGNARFSDDFKRDAVHQVTMRGYPVAEVSKRLGVSTHSLYIWVKKFSKSSEVDAKDDHATENRRLKRELARVIEERDIQKRATVRRPAGEQHFHREGTSPRMPNEVCVYSPPGRVLRSNAREGTCCPNRVARLARLAGIKAQIDYKRRPGKYGGKPSVVVDNTLNRQFDVDAPDRFCLSVMQASPDGNRSPTLPTLKPMKGSCIWRL